MELKNLSRDELIDEAEGGNIDAYWQLAICCAEQGDSDSAEQWCMKAIDAGQPDALLEAAKAYDDKENDFFNAAVAMKFYKAAAEKGCGEAMVYVADKALKYAKSNFYDCRHTDNSSAKEHKKQFNAYKAAAENGYAPAMKYIADAYEKGYPVECDKKMAFEWYSRAAEKYNNSDALFSLGRCYEDGIGTGQNIHVAMIYYRRAAERNNIDAITRLYEIYKHGADGVYPNESKATNYLILLTAAKKQ